MVLEGFISQGSIPHLLLVGAVGSGKTTIARILTTKLDCAVLELNASDERGIDTVRDRVKTFLMSLSTHALKICFLDEADNLTPDAQMCLRNVMEKYSERGRFILTANFEERIIEPLRSRCQTLRFNQLDRKQVFKRVVFVLTKEGVSFETDDVLRLVDELYPDIRKILNTVQLHTREKKFKYEAPVDVLKEVREAIKEKNLRGIREVVSENKPDFVILFRGLFDSIGEMEIRARASSAITIAEYLFRDSMIADREINFAACCLELMKEV